MSQTEIDERPVKKRRFFTEEEVAPSNSPHGGEPTSVHSLQAAENQDEDFNPALLSAFIGETLSDKLFQKLRHLSNNNIERDGSWKTAIDSAGSKEPEITLEPRKSSHLSISHAAKPKVDPLTRLERSPRRRYIGAFGVTGWATRSGQDLLTYGEKVKIERQTPTGAMRPGNFGRPVVSRRNDIIVRFTNTRGEEVGRLENESAAWVSSLLDQHMCELDGYCVFAPDRIRTNDTIYLQLRTYLLKTVFDGLGFAKMDQNRETGIFEAKESTEEKKLRLRQVALVKLFDEINMQPSKVDDETQKRKREGLLLAAENADKQDEQGMKSNTKKATPTNGSSSPADEIEEGEELEQGQLDALYQKAQSFDFDTPIAEPPSTFILDLRKYQKQALYWMLSKERNEKEQSTQQSMHPLWEEYTWPEKDVDDKDVPKVEGQDKFYVNMYSGEMSLEFPVQEQNCFGGILADEMGLGKTIEMLSLIHSHKDKQLSSSTTGPSSVRDLPRLPQASSTTEWAPSTTLVIAPMSLLAQWHSEAMKASEEGSVRAFLYYGNEKNVNLRNMCSQANASLTPNIIITSYGTILSEYNQVANLGGMRGSHGGLFSLDYFRIILDEAHFIKNRQSKTAKACYELKARHRWVLTGTPIVNRLEDLFSLVHFLRVEPWSNFSFWKTFITVPFESKDFIRALDVVQTVLEPLVLRRTKDMKTPNGEALVPLPPRKISISKIELSQAERAVYDFIFTRAKQTFAANIEAGTVMKSFTTIFAQILRLRQSCCHPMLIRNKEIAEEDTENLAATDLANGLADDMDLDVLLERFSADTTAQDASNFGTNVLRQIQSESSGECPICSEEPMVDQVFTGCWHSACKQCLLDYIEHQKSKGEIPKCFNCREPINSRDIFEVIRHEANEEVHGELKKMMSSVQSTSTPTISLRRIGADGSAKISELLSQLRKLRQEEPLAKSVVFSQFTSFLDIIEPALARDRIQFVRFDGSMSQKKRAMIIDDFVSRKRGVVLLLSLRAGGVGLNLTAAKQVFMMDPWWSFAVEAQAIDRVHRMGQDSEVTVTRFIVEGSIEEKMLRIQDRKKFIASSLGMMNDEEKKLQRIEDIKELLS